MYLSLLRSVLRTARRLHYFNNTELMENVWVPPIEETDNVYLDETKLRELEEADLTFEGILTYIEEITDTEIKEELKKYFAKKKHCDWINTTRDILLFGCMSGQRYSDYIRISKDMFEIIKGRTFIHVQQKKTKADVYIPLTSKMQTIINRYGGKIPYMNVNKLAKMIKHFVFVHNSEKFYIKIK